MGVFNVVAALVALISLSARGFQLSQRGLYWDDLVIPSYYSGFNPVGGASQTSAARTSAAQPGAAQPGASAMNGSLPDSGKFAAEQLSSAVGKNAPSVDASIPERLFSPYDGHLMPGSGALQLAVNHVAPLSWWLPAAIILLVTAVTTGLWFLVARRVVRLGASPGVALIVFTALCTSPFLGAAAGWWSASINAFAWQIAAAGIMLLGLREKPSPLAQTIGFTAIQFTALLFTEKALSLIAVIAVIAVFRALHFKQPALLQAMIAPVILTVVWAAWYLSVVDSPVPDEGFAVTTAIPRALGSLIIPGMFGGPWSWDRWHPGSPFASLPWGVGMVLAVVALASCAFGAKQLRNHNPHAFRRVLTISAAVVVASAGYLTLILVFMIRSRTSTGTTDLLPRTPHYYADWWSFSLLSVLAAAVAVGSASTDSPDSSIRRPALRSCQLSWGSPAVIGAVVLTISATISVTTWATSWHNDISQDYLANLKHTVVQPHRAGQIPPLLNQPVRTDVLYPLLHPFNSVNSLTGVPVATHTSQPKVVNDDGKLVDAGVLKVASNKKGEQPQCGTRITAGAPKLVLLDKPLPFGDWTWEFNAAATSDARVRITMPNGLQSAGEVAKRAVTVPVGTQPQTQWVRMNGVGGTIAVEVQGPAGTSVCLGEGAIGPLLPAP